MRVYLVSQSSAEDDEYINTIQASKFNEFVFFIHAFKVMTVYVCVH